MKKNKLFFFFALIGLLAFGINWAVSSSKMDERENRSMVDTRIDNSQYWVKMAEAGYIPFNPDVTVERGIFTGSEIKSPSVITEDSPDVPVTDINSTQSENSIFVDPNDPDIVLNSNNSTQNPVGSLYGANDLYSFDIGETWEGEVQGAGGSNSGDPTTAIGLNGRWYVNYINNPGGMGISYSDDQGQTWTTKTIAPNPGQLADKNHMWIDNSPDSPYEGNLYVAWTNFGGSNDSEISISVSADDGVTWSTGVPISNAVNAGSHNQGVNIQTGPDGEVYAIWGIYDSWPSDESAIGMAKSLDGGITWEPAIRIIDNIRGIRTSETSKNQRVNSFPASAVDISSGEDRGSFYVTWTNYGVPGINTGNDIDIYVIKSIDGGENWSIPVRVNQDEAGLGNEHYFPWITVDPSSGIVSLVFYDDRNVGSNKCEVFCANSDDGGVTWEDFQVSDVSFTPSPIPGLAGGYMGDYLGIIARDGWVYPVWCDNRAGAVMTYCSPYQTNPLNRPRDLTGLVTFETGEVELEWSYIEAENFQNFNIYRDDELVGTTSDTTYNEMLPDYGIYSYKVTALYTEDLESSAARTDVQWGDAHISVSPLSIYESLVVDSSSTQYITVINTGQLELDYTITPFVEGDRSDSLEYCTASSTTIDEWISRVTVGDIDNESGGSLYTDYTNLSTSMQPGISYEITVEVGNSYSSDVGAAWIDWNRNGIFDDGKINFDGSPGNGPYTATIIPPPEAVSGVTRMRVRLGYSEELQPCGETTYGEVEDYSINVQGWFGIEPLSGVVNPGDTTMIAVNFDASNVDPGIYNATALFSSNDPNQDEVSVDLTLEIRQMLVVASALDDIAETCIGGSLQLLATPYGVYDTAIYTWHTADPDGWMSEEQNPIITPDESAWYFVVLQDTATSVTDSIYISVYQLPTVDLGNDTTVCENASITLDAGNPGATYLWSTGDTTQTIVANGSGETMYWVDVNNENACSNQDTVYINFAAIPVVNLGDDITTCENESVTLDAGNQGSTYLWSTGASTQTIDVSGEGETMFWVEVTNESSCSVQDTVYINFAAVPEVNLGNDTIVCQNGTFTLNAGNAGSAYLWSTGETTQSITFDASDYAVGVQAITVDVTNPEGCTSGAEKLVEIRDCTGIGENDADSQFEVYPNPSQGIFTVSFNSGISKNSKLRIISETGNIVFEQSNIAAQDKYRTKINLASQPHGIYFVELIIGNQTFNKKLLLK